MAKSGAAKSVRASGSKRRAPAVTLYDDIQDAWGNERPDLDLRMASALLKIEHVNHLHEARVQAISKVVGVNTGDLYVLLALRRIGTPFEARPTDLFRALLVTSGAITKRIARLHEEGLVLRVQSNDDGRSELVRLTAKGVSIADKAIGRISDVVGIVASNSGLTEGEINVLNICLNKLLSVTDEVTI